MKYQLMMNRLQVQDKNQICLFKIQMPNFFFATFFLDWWGRRKRSALPNPGTDYADKENDFDLIDKLLQLDPEAEMNEKSVEDFLGYDDGDDKRSQEFDTFYDDEDLKGKQIILFIFFEIMYRKIFISSIYINLKVNLLFMI